MSRVRRLTVTALMALAAPVWALASVGVAQATVTHSFIRSFGPEGFDAAGAVGAFTKLEGVAVEQSSEDVYVYDAGSGGAVYKFDAAGEPAPFSKLQEENVADPDVLTGVGGAGAGEEELAVDSSAGPDKGDIYIANNSEILIYAESGEKLASTLTGGEACGVAVDPAGHVYVGFYPETIYEYVPVTNPVTNADQSIRNEAPLEKICNVAVDGKGSVYAATYSGGIQMLASLSAGSGESLDPAGNTLAIDPSNNDVYVDEGGDIAQYEASGTKLLGSFGASGELAGSEGVALNGTSGAPASGDVYADNGDGVVDVFGPAIVSPTPLTGGASNLLVTGATLEGTVNPEGPELLTCEFEWGETESYGHETPCSELPPAGNTTTAVHADLTGLQPHTLYHYRLRATSKDGSGAAGADKTFFTQVPAPILDDTATAAANVSQFSATLNGTINPGNGAVNWHFVYGPTGAYGSVAPTPDGYTPVNDQDDEVTQTIGGLRAGTTYHFALVASSPGGTEIVGPDETFTTAPIPLPSLSIGEASGITRSAATLAGAVDPSGWETTYTFQYGTTAGYGQQWPTVPVVIGALDGAQPVTIYLENLQPTTTYHYRLVASNGGGTSYGPDQTFTTGAYPLSIVQEPPVLAPAVVSSTTKKTKAKSKPAKHKAGKAKHGKQGRPRAKKKT